MNSSYTTADAMFDAEAMGKRARPRHGIDCCACCEECGWKNGNHSEFCLFADDGEEAAS